MFTQIDSSVNLYAVRTRRTNQPLLIRCKGSIFFSHVQINVKKNMVCHHFIQKNAFAPHLRHVTAFAL